MKPARVDEAGWTVWPAPAKLNLFLHIVGRRDDGYHLLQTVFQLLDHGDRVRLRPRADGELRRIDPIPGVAPEHDLAVRAARALAAETGCRLGADLAIDKRIPMGGGLGGGSSDAATTLRALNAVWGTGLDLDTLARIGLGLGADVPVFVHGRSAWAEGVGESLTPIAVPVRWFVVVDPGVEVSTAALFQAPELTRDARPLTISRFLCGISVGNAFEPLVRSRWPAVAAALDWLGQYGEARLSGTGGCVFVAVPSREQGDSILASLPSGLSGFVAQGLADSPLHAAVRAFHSAAASV